MSEGCDNCYAASLSQRLLSRIYRRRLPVVDTAANRNNPFAVRIWPERLDQPAQWREPHLIFVNSMSDLFHSDVPPDFLRAVFRVMLDVDRHTYQVLTKRPGRAARFVRENTELLGGGGAAAAHLDRHFDRESEDGIPDSAPEAGSGGGPVPELRAADRAVEPLQGAEFGRNPLGHRGG